MDRRLAVHRTIVIVDVEGFGDPRRTNRHQVETRGGLYCVMQEAFEHTGIPWDRCDHEDRGDGILVLVPAEIPKSLLVESLPMALLAALRSYNAKHPSQQSVRLRMVLHAGEVCYDEHGVTSASVNLAFRLIDAKELKAALARSAGPLAVIASSWFYEDVVQHTFLSAEYTPVSVAVKETAVTGWISLPNYSQPADRDRPDALSLPVQATTPQPISALRALPRDVPVFTGRAPELARLEALISQSRSDAEPISVHAINGMAGVGKTTFAVHSAHLLSDRFPDGQVFLQLHAHTPGQRPVDPAEALGTLLLSTGVPPWYVPGGLEARSMLWRSHLAGKQMLLVFDDAAGSDQIRPLLPGASDCLVIVTSRRRLALWEAVTTSLDMLPAAEAANLFVRSAGRPDLQPDNAVVAETVHLCGYLPLAIRLTAARLEHHPALTVGDLASEIASARSKSAAMQAENVSVAAAFDLSYQHLTAGQQRMFRRLGVHPGTDIDICAAAALTDVDADQARHDIEALYDQNLLTELSYGRYRMHDLIREHAYALAATDQAPERESALRRFLEYYLRSVRAARSRQDLRIPARPPLSIDPPPGQIPDPPVYEDASAWIDKERHNLYAAVTSAALNGHARYAAAIAAEMHSFLRLRGDWRTARELHQTAGHAAHQANDRAAEAGAVADLGDMQYLTGAYLDAAATLSRALRLYRDLAFDTRLEEANVLTSLGEPLHLAGDMPGSVNCQKEALALYRELGNQLGEATALNRLGILQALTGPYQEAVDSQTKALELYRALGNAVGQAIALSNLGGLQLNLGNKESAAANLARALEIDRSTGNIVGEINTLTRSIIQNPM